MFSAIVTAMLGIFWANRLGWLDLSRVAMPTTDIVPQLIGAVLFGAGFAIASLCPGTACVSAATGTRDGLVTIGGLFAGTLVTSLLWSQLGAIAERAPKENATLATDLGLSPGLVVALITLVALIAIPASDRIAAWRRSGGAPVARARFRLSPLAAIALALGTLAAASGKAASTAGSAMQRTAADADAAADHVDALVLAQWIRDRKPRLRIIDVREGLAADDYRIPGAEDVPLQRIAQLDVHAGETLALYGDGSGQAAKAWTLLHARGVRNAVVLRDGMAAWEDNILSPRFPSPDDTAAVRRFDQVRDLSAWFGGRPSHAPAALVANPASRRRKSC
jgi:rhodanese-related sulfurtransferase